MKLDLKQHLKEMISAPGLSGYEAPIREIIRAAWQPLADEIRVNNFRSLHPTQRDDRGAHGRDWSDGDRH